MDAGGTSGSGVVIRTTIMEVVPSISRMFLKVDKVSSWCTPASRIDFTASLVSAAVPRDVVFPPERTDRVQRATGQPAARHKRRKGPTSRATYKVFGLHLRCWGLYIRTHERILNFAQSRRRQEEQRQDKGPAGISQPILSLRRCQTEVKNDYKLDHLRRPKR